mmetsp:Transcript_78910/g.218320  ORF Transcript_78910/g.218320 Transcript_78910/m.218320 type:complete len:275 (+) Transcript_78910:510-1334(+)
MHREGVHRVIDPRDPRQRGGNHEEQSADGPDDQGPAGVHDSATRTDGNQADQDTLAHAVQVAPPDDRKPQAEADNSADGGGKRGIRGSVRSLEALLDALHGHGGAADEAVPAEPEHEGAEGDQLMAVGHEVMWVVALGTLPPTLALEAALALASEEGAEQGADAADEVDDAAACEVQVTWGAHLSQPTHPPGPGHDQRVDEAAKEERKEKAAQEVHALCCTSSGDDRSQGAEGPAEEPIHRGHGRLELPVGQGFEETRAGKLLRSREAIHLVGR